MSVQSEWSNLFNVKQKGNEVALVKSPFSEIASDNAKAGRISDGVLTQEYEPPKSNAVGPEPANYRFYDRLDVSKVTPESDIIKKREGFRTKKTDVEEGFAIPGLVDSHFIPDVAPAVRADDYSYLDTPVEEKEAFTNEQKNTIIVIVVAIVCVCIVGLCFGLLVPKFRINHKIKTVGGPTRETAF